MSDPTEKRVIPEFFGKLYPQDASPNASLLGTWVRRAEVDALLAEIERLRPMAESWESYEAAQERKSANETKALPASLTLVLETLELREGESFLVQVKEGLSETFWYGLSDLFSKKSAQEPKAHPRCHCGGLLERLSIGQYKCAVCSIIPDEMIAKETKENCGSLPPVGEPSGANRPEEWCMHLTTYEDCPYGCTPEKATEQPAPETLVAWVSQYHWRCRCKAPGNINTDLSTICKDCGTARPETISP
jgi:hypothetical protein